MFLLVLVEIGFFPLLCGWWLDICSLVSFAVADAILRDGLVLREIVWGRVGSINKMPIHGRQRR